MDGDGLVTGQFSFTHDAAAIGAMVKRLVSAGVAGVAIERGDGPVVEQLLGAGLAVFVVPNRQVKGLRDDELMPESSKKKRTNPALPIHKALVRWAASRAQLALHVFEDRRPNDDRPRAAVGGAREPAGPRDASDVVPSVKFVISLSLLHNDRNNRQP